MSCAYAFGPHQFAYSPERGARDALAYYVLRWILGLSQGLKIVVYCSDVSGAFDHVSARRLLSKLRSKGIHEHIVLVLQSWLQPRTAHVIVDGCSSKALQLSDMVFQGTVLGPPLWNVFYEDARIAVDSHNFEEVVYADDFNCFRLFDRGVPNFILLEEARHCQKSLHAWGHANQVCFDPGKEHIGILSMTEPVGDNFKLLGVEFDPKLRMNGAISACVVDVSWRMRSLLRTRRFYNDAEMLMFFKAHILPMVEYRTAAFYHACTTAQRLLDHILENLLNQLGISQVEALVHFRLAPLRTRRDIAMLGLIHRSVLGRGPPQFRSFFLLETPVRRSRRVWHSKQLRDPRDSSHSTMLARSALGLVRIYNLLPQDIVDSTSVKSFQQALQALVMMRAKEGCHDWPDSFSPRLPLLGHPLW